MLQTLCVPVSALQSMGLEEALEHVNVPSYVIDTSGIIRWLNPAAERIVGDVRGGISRQSLHRRTRSARARVRCSRARSSAVKASQLHLSTETVRNHIRRVLRATGAHSRLEAVAIANGAY
jgi:PAS domain-containing protein